MGIFQIIQGVVNLVGGDGTLTDVFNQGGRNRIAVSSIKALPSDQPIAYSIPFLLDGAATNMNIDGSGTPVVFTLTPGAGKEFFVEKINLFMRDQGAFKLDEFGSGKALTTGIKLEIKSKGVLQTALIVKNNRELIENIDNLNTFSQIEGNPLFVMSKVFEKPITLLGDQGDFIKLTIQDDLTFLQEFFSKVKYWEVI